MDPQTPGSLGGVAWYAEAQGLTHKEALRELQGELALFDDGLRRSWSWCFTRTNNGKPIWWRCNLSNNETVGIATDPCMVPVKNKTGTVVT